VEVIANDKDTSLLRSGINYSLKSFIIQCGLYFKHIMVIVSDASTINVSALAQAIVVNYAPRV
jgi:hypothetical protein